MTRSRTAALLCVVLTLGCALSDDLKTSEGQALTPADKAELTAPFQRSPWPAPTGPVTLEKLLTSIDGGSLDLDMVRQQVLQASSRVDQARSALLPNFAVSVDASIVAKRSGQAFFKSDQATLRASAGLTIPLDLSGTLAERVRAAQARYRAATVTAEVTRREQRAALVLSYFNLLEAESLVGVTEASIAQLERELADIRARLDAGTVRRSDVLSVEVALAESRQRRIELETTRQESVRAVNLAAGFPIGHATQLAPWPHRVVAPVSALPDLDHARTTNPEVDVLVETLVAIAHDREAADRSTLPSINIGPQVTFDSTSSLDPKVNANGFLSVAWNPDFNGRVAAEIRELDATRAEVEVRVRTLLRRIEDRILAAHRRAIEAESASRVASESLVQATENRRVIQEQLHAGVATGRDSLEAEAALTRTRATVVTSQYRVALGVFQMRFAAGEDPLDTLKVLTAP